MPTSTHPSGGAPERPRLDDPLLDRYLEFVESRARHNTLLATASDPKVFFAFAAKPPTEVTTGDVLAPATDGVTTALIDGAVAELVRRRNGCPDDAGARVSCLIGLAVEAGDRLHDKLLASRAAWQETQPAGLAR